MDIKKLESFKEIVLKKMNLTSESEIDVFNQFPDTMNQRIFENNFNGNLQLARKIIFNEFDQNDYKKIENEKIKINDMKKAAHLLSKSLSEGTHSLFLTDTDNDGSLAQANLLSFEKALPDNIKNNFTTLYCQVINGNTTRGFTVDLVDAWVERNPEFKDKPFNVISADNGINSREEQLKIQEKYPKSKLIVTDHHLPDVDDVVLENKNTLIVNPKYKSRKYFEDKNISGANVLGTLLELTLNNLDENPDVVLTDKKSVIFQMREVSRIANLLDYVYTDISDKPLQDHLIEKYSSLGGLMNVNNSLNKIITSKYTDDEIKDIFSDVENLDMEPILESIKKIKEQNKFAEKLLTLHYRYSVLKPEAQNSIPKDRIHKDLVTELTKKDLSSISNGINPNFIEQLRPVIYFYAASNKLTNYEDGIQEKMKEIYLKIKKSERVLQEVFGKTDLLQIEKLDNATIMYPKNNNYLKLLNRKLLGKIFNEENNGLLMILDNIEKQKATGSFRSIYAIQEILKNKSSIEDVLNVKLSFQGHDKAAGFFIESRDGSDLNHRAITDITNFISKSIEGLKQEENKNYSHLIQIDFNIQGIEILNKFNKAIKGSLTNMQSLSPAFQFNNHTYLTNSVTQKEESLQELVKNKKYGYVPIQMTFDGKTIILPTEMLRQIAKSNFKDGLQVSFMNDGVFIGNKVIPNINSGKLTRIRTVKNRVPEMSKFFIENYENNGYFTTLPIEKIKYSPFFKFNKYGENEYKRYESTIIDVIDRANLDMFVVADTEANGLGNAPKLSNLGIVELIIDEKSGFKMSQKLFSETAFKSMQGNKYILEKDQISDLQEITGFEYDMLTFKDKQNVIINMENEKERYISPSSKGYKKLHNVKKYGKSVILNRELRSNIGSIFIKDKDVKMSETIISLTGFDNSLLNKHGISSEKADGILYERYKDKKIVFQAHNSQYDLGVIKANLRYFYELITSTELGNYLNDSAIYSRRDKLSYDPIGIAGFEANLIPAMKGIQFFHSDQSELSLEKFLSNNKDGVLSDRNGRYVLKKKNQKVSIIDTTENTEVNLVKPEFTEEEALDLGISYKEEPIIEYLSGIIKKSDMPQNGIKYSVQSLSDYDIIRSLILSNADFEIKSIEVPDIFQESKSILEFYMMNYHFDTSPDENIRNFSKTLSNEEMKDLFVTEGFIEEQMASLKEEWLQEQIDNPPKRKRKMPDFSLKVGDDPKVKSLDKFTNDFLNENIELQGKFHEIWAYKKVLHVINPNKDNIKDKKVIDLVSYNTSLDKEKVKSIMQDAIDFKDTYGMDNVIQKEPHNNIFFDESDVVMEAVLASAKRMVNRHYNSYTHSVDDVSTLVLENMLTTTAQHLMTQQRNMAEDSYSKKQANSYDRAVLTEYIERSQKLDIENVKFKFGRDVLAPDTFAYGALKKELTQDQISEASKKLEFIAAYEQLEYSLRKEKAKSEARVKKSKGKLVEDLNDSVKEGDALNASIKSILDKNIEKVDAIRDEMSELFEAIYYSRKENDTKKYLKQAVESILTNERISPNKNAEPLMEREKDVVVDIVVKYINMAEALGINSIPNFTNEEVDFLHAKEITSKNNTLDDFVDASTSEEQKVLNTDNPLVIFLSQIKSISEKDVLENNQKDEDKLLAQYSNESEAKKILARKKILPSVKMVKRDISKELLAFNDLLDNHLSDLMKPIEVDLDLKINNVIENKNKIK